MEILQNFQEVRTNKQILFINNFECRIFAMFVVYEIFLVHSYFFIHSGGRKGAAVLCELLKAGSQGQPQGPGSPSSGRPGGQPGSRPGGGRDGGYPDYYGQRNRNPYN
jgi:hypothetical protein